MTAQGETVTTAIAIRQKQDKLITWVRAQHDDFAAVAATHIKPATMIRLTQGALRRNEKLLAAAIANPPSLLYALLECARLGHEPDTGQYWLIPFGDEVTGVEGYKGIIDRMFRAGQVSAVVAEVVRGSDHYRSRGPTMPPEHEYDEFADPGARGELRGVYAYAVMADGRCSMVRRIGKAEIERRMKAGHGWKRADSPWKLWPEPMWKKCPLRDLEAYVPTSSEWRTTAPAPAPVSGLGSRRAATGHAVPVLPARPGGEDTAAEPPASPVAGSAHGGTGPAAGGRPAAGPRDPAETSANAARAPVAPSRQYEADSQAVNDLPLPGETGDIATNGDLAALSALFADAGWEGDDHRADRLTVTGILAAPGGQAPLKLGSSAQLTSAQAQRATRRLRQLAAAPGEFPAALAGIAAKAYAAGEPS
jgi:recombination protein RecT